MMKKTKKGLTRLLAICVCLIVVLSACASAPSGESTTTAESKETSALELSEVNAESTSSEAEPSDEESSESEPSAPESHISADSEATLSGDITITPIEPTYPEERETTLEKLATFEMGENGLVKYGFLYAEDPSDPTILPLARYFADDKGNVYAYRGGIITCLNTGAVMNVVHCNCAQLLLCGDTLYIRDHDATIYRYAPFGKEDMALVETYLNEDLERALVKMIDVGKEEPILEIDRERFCTLENTLVTDADITFSLKNTDGEYTVLRTKEQPYEIYNKYGIKPIVSACSEQGITMSIYQNSRNCPGRLECFEYLYARYDDKGNILSQFMLEFFYSGRVPCEMPYPAGVLTSYNGMTATIGNYLFEGTLGQEVIEGENGTYYLVVCYPDYGEVYKINPGYSSKGLTDPESDKEQTDEDGVSTANETAAATTEGIVYAPVSREEAAQKASSIMETEWTLVEAHTVQRANTQIPGYLIKENVTSSQEGIPYCWGGFHDSEEFVSLTNANPGGGYSRYMTGNIYTETDGHQPGTIGLDCSGFAGRVTGIRSTGGGKPGSARFIAFGHEVTFGDLELWDVIVKPDVHVMFYAGVSLIQGEYMVCDTSSHADDEKTNYRSVSESYYSDSNGYRFFHVYSEYGHNANQHWTQCASCQGYKTDYEPHTFGNYVSISASSHAKVCTICGYQTNVQSHTFTYTPDLVGRHAKSCATCGYSATELHTYSTEYSFTMLQHWQTCTRCGIEAIRASHTLSYEYSTTQHWQACETCGHSRPKSAHTYNIYGVCTVCGYRGTIMKSDEPDLPQDVPEVPTDDFIVLCVEPKEEFWESVQR